MSPRAFTAEHIMSGLQAAGTLRPAIANMQALHGLNSSRILVCCWHRNNFAGLQQWRYGWLGGLLQLGQAKRACRHAIHQGREGKLVVSHLLLQDYILVLYLGIGWQFHLHGRRCISGRVCFKACEHCTGLHLCCPYVPLVPHHGNFGN